MMHGRFASPQKRVLAKFIDFGIVLALGQIPFGTVGAILGFFYSIGADALAFRKVQGQSLGKKLLRIRVTSDAESKGRASRIKTSIIRNAPVGMVTFLMIIPIWGWILGLILGVPLFLIELSLMIRADRRQRLGDVMAESVVLDCE